MGDSGVRNGLRREVIILPLFRESGEGFGVALRSRAIQLALQLKVHRLAGDPRVRALCEQLLDHLHSIQRGGENQGCLLPCGFAGIHVRTIFRKNRHRFSISRTRSQMQRSRTAVRRHRRHVGTGVDEKAYDSVATRSARKVQGCVLTDARHAVHTGSTIDQHLGDRRVPTLGSPVKGGHSVAVGGVDVGPRRKQRAYHIGLATHRGVRDRRLSRRKSHQKHCQAQSTQGSYASTGLPYCLRHL